MFNRLIRILSLCLLVSITFSFLILKGQGQQRNQTGASEITFIGKEETRWTEKREVPLPVVIGQGVKEEPRVDTFDLREDAIGPMKKMSPSTTQPGCAYRSGLTRGIAKVFVGDKALYEKGRYHYFERDYEDAILIFQKLIREYPDSYGRDLPSIGSGKQNFIRGRMTKPFRTFRKWLRNIRKVNFMSMPFIHADGFNSRREPMKRGIDFSIKSTKRTPPIPSPNHHSSGLGTASIILVDTPRHFGRRRFCSRLSKRKMEAGGRVSDRVSVTSDFKNSTRQRIYSKISGNDFRGILWRRAPVTHWPGAWSLWENIPREEKSLRRCSLPTQGQGFRILSSGEL